MPEANSRRPYSRIKPVCAFETPEIFAIALGASSSVRPRPTLNQPSPVASRFALDEGRPGCARWAAYVVPSKFGCGSAVINYSPLVLRLRRSLPWIAVCCRKHRQTPCLRGTAEKTTNERVRNRIIAAVNVNGLYRRGRLQQRGRMVHLAWNDRSVRYWSATPVSFSTPQVTPR